MRPVARLTVGDASDSISSTSLGGGGLSLPEAGAVSLEVRLDTGAGHDRVETLVSHLSPIAGTEPGTQVSVAFAAEGEPVDVLVVDVQAIEERPDGVLLTGYAPSHRLSDVWFSQTYVRQSVADVVNDLLNQADVDAGAIDATLALEQFHVDGRRSAWETLHQLARLVGAEITSDSAGAVSFVPAPGADAGGLGGALAGAASSVASALGAGGDSGLRRGANLLSWSTGPRRAEAGPTIAIAPLGAASSVGAGGAHHLVKAPESGEGQAFVAPQIRTAEGGSTASTARSAQASRRQRCGHFVTPGDPTQRPGTDIEIAGESWHVISVQHRIDGARGFVTELRTEGTA